MHSVTNANSEESVYVGDDLEVDILGCQESGIDGVYFNPNKIKHKENPKYEISCLSELKKLFLNPPFSMSIQKLG